MSQQNIDNGDSFGIQRGKINENFSELYSIKIESSQVLVKTNTTPFTPTLDYHPSTKLYADGLITSWHSVYNPQSINADVFDRSNHTGNLSPSVITEDPDNRFVTDVQITNWNQKEDGIGAKGTAFNKNFGTIAGTVAEGNHMHTKADIGLGNVDNTSDVNKPVSDAQQAALDLKSNIDDIVDVAAFNIDYPKPAHAEGLIFYDRDSKAISGYNDIPGVTVNYGLEELIRIKNTSGATIINGKPCKSVGVDVTTGLVLVALAQADDYVNSQVIGIATHDIPNGGLGYLTVRGGVHDIDTSSFSIGDILYLSDTVAGGYITTPPNIATQIGQIRVSHATTGVLFVGLTTNIELPSVFGQLYDVSDLYDLTTTYQNIVNYDNEDSVVCPTNKLLGTISPEYSGKYRLSLGINLSFASTISSRSVDVRLYDATDSVEIDGSVSTIPIARDITSVSRSYSPPVDIIADHDHVIQIKASETIDDVSITVVTFDLESIKIS